MEKHAENDFKDNISRRSFLQKTTAAVAAYTMVKPAQVCGTQANSRIKIGVIGMGWRG
ncbi:MAG: twin-arginine translocation signal domain-containing protein, partial [Planctomycetes bacterium]|nr:twin-arginine translocation signal domain-containing protein [Planctomycetota bacterium]